MAVSTRKNSTNVRLDSPLDPWPMPDVPPERAPRWAIAGWTAFVVAAAAAGVFARVEAGAYAALVAFAWVFIAGSARLDREVVAALAARAHPLRDALGLDVAAAACMWIVHASGTLAWASVPGAFALLVAVPLAAVLHAEAARRPRVRKAAGASPAAKRAAT